MNIDFMTGSVPAGKKKPKNALKGAIEIAIRDAERYGTDLVIKTGSKIERVSPKAMRKRVGALKS